MQMIGNYLGSPVSTSLTDFADLEVPRAYPRLALLTASTIAPATPPVVTLTNRNVSPVSSESIVRRWMSIPLGADIVHTMLIAVPPGFVLTAPPASGIQSNTITY